tara:strand:+ start:1834 stop:2127 length:294 start_codon:yes stop_codon:yes gene_type:complete
MNTKGIAQKLAELKFGKKQVALSTDKVGYKLADAMALESTLQSVIDHFRKDEAYRKSSTMKVIERHSDDQIKPKRTVSDVLNDCNVLAKEVTSLISK